MRAMKGRPHGFTLIELLIVVAIIAILALIAVPNFLEAQTRAKVSRVKSDMRTIATGLESYMVDHNTYPQPSAWLLINPSPFRMQAYVALTTPVAYLTTGIIRDPFVKYGSRDDPAKITFEIGFSNPGTPALVLDEKLENQGIPTNRSMYLIHSFGPDYADDTYLGEFGSYDANGKVTGEAIIYDPTNGTVSQGDIYRIQAPADFVQYYTIGPQ